MKEDLKLIIGIICLILLFIKIQIHNYLDIKNEYAPKSSSGFRFNFIFLLPYFQEVNNDTKKTKTICNIIWLVFSTLLVIVLLM